MNVGDIFFNAQKILFDHVGFTPDWVEYAIDDSRQHFWFIKDGFVRYHESKEILLNSDGEYYQDDIYTQRFYEKHVYRGKEVTMVFCNPGVDGCKWFRIFDNEKEVELI